MGAVALVMLIWPWGRGGPEVPGVRRVRVVVAAIVCGWAAAWATTHLG